MGWQYFLCDVATNTTLVDLTGYAYPAKVSVRLNRPTSVELTVPGDTTGLWTLAADGYPNLEGGIRSIKAVQDSVLRANVLVWSVAPTGDENSTSVLITGHDPLVRLKTRPLRDVSGNFINPNFVSPISGGKIIKDAVVNSVTWEGALPINTASGAYNLVSPPAPDLGAQLENWPIMIGDLVTLLTNTGCVDVVMKPLATAGVIGELNAVTEYGTDRTATVHFDYATGDYSVRAVRRFFDMDEVCNKLWYYLGPKLTPLRFRGNITGTELPTNEVQTVTIGGGPTGGTFTLTHGGYTTGSLAYNASAATVQTALRALTSIGSPNVTVTGSAGGPYTVEFVSALAAMDVPLMTATNAFTGGSSTSVTIATTTQGLLGNVAEQALQTASRAKYGVYMDIQVYDQGGNESDARPMFTELWKTEVRLRVQPRELLYITPVAGSVAPYRPFIDYDRGDLITVNALQVGKAVSANQRIYGFDVESDRDGVERVSEFIVSADGA